MDFQGIAQLAHDFGPSGLIVAYMVWHQIRIDRLNKERTERADGISEKRAAADVEVAKSLALLTAAIEGLKR